MFSRLPSSKRKRRPRRLPPEPTHPRTQRSPQRQNLLKMPRAQKHRRQTPPRRRKMSRSRNPRPRPPNNQRNQKNQSRNLPLIQTSSLLPNQCLQRPHLLIQMPSRCQSGSIHRAATTADMPHCQSSLRCARLHSARPPSHMEASPPLHLLLRSSPHHNHYRL